MQSSESYDGDGGDENDDDDDGGVDSTPFLPFAAAAATNLPRSQSSTTAHQDPGATLRGDILRPNTIRRTTSERVQSFQDPSAQGQKQPLINPLSTIASQSSPTSSTSSTSNPNPNPSAALPPTTQQPSSSTRTNTNPLSPRQAAALNAAGLSPRLSRRNGGNATTTGQTSDSTGTPSMGSSFSDLDDTSVTQSALEEALLSNMQRGGGSTVSGTGGGLASRIGGIGKGIRSRYL